MKVGVIEEMLEDTMEALPDPADDDIKEIMLFKIFHVCSIVLVN